jgi:TolB-like protein/Tfp pilus assembly protein PilF/predicted Ser/Thr protein kinase
MDLTPPATLSHYRILEKLGEGGMGEVYLAEDTLLDRKVALKLLSERLQKDPTARKRFLQEAKSAAAIDHPYICNIFDVGEEGGRNFIAMEYVTGHTLEERLAEGPLPVSQALVVSSEIAEALEEAHGKNLVHRDLKPSNIMLTPGGHAKVMDFGLAKQLALDGVQSEDETESRLTQQGHTAGTLSYMSPEQLCGREVDLRSDIFSFGVVLYEMVTGAHPFRKGSPMETASAIQQDVPPPLSRYTEDAPELLHHVVRKMLAQDLDQRYQLMHEVRTDLAELAGLQSGAPVQGFQAPSHRRPFTRPVTFAVAGLIAVAVLIAWFIHRQQETGMEAGEISSLAVLPLDNMTGDPEQQYFVDGMHEALITELSKISALRVISRKSVRRYQDTEESIEEIARRLKVDACVEGSVLRSQNLVRITAQLIAVRPERHLWADHFERELGDVINLQGEVARAIADQIHVTLSPEEQRRLASRRQVPPEAHDAYLRGVYYLDQLGEDAVRKSLEEFRRAAEIAPDYAPAQAGMAEAHLAIGGGAVGAESPREALARSRAYAERALELDGDLADAHLILARVDLQSEWNWAAAERELERHLELDPSSAGGHGFYSWVLLLTGRIDEAVEELKRTIELEPLSHTYT